MSVGTGICLMSCKNGLFFAKKVFNSLNKIYAKEKNKTLSFCETKEVIFANSEIKTNILQSIRGKDVFIFQDMSNTSNGYSVNDNLMALKTLVSAAKLSDAIRVTVVIPTFPYARQDKPWGREAITAKIICQDLENCGVDNIITLDIHNRSITGFLNKINLIDLKAFLALSTYIEENIDLNNSIVSSPDVGGMKRVTKYTSKLKIPAVTVYKERDYSCENKVQKMQLIGDVKNKDVLIVDDMLDTGGTVYNAIKLFAENGAKDVYVFCSLPFFNNPAKSRLQELYDNNLLKKVIGTNTVYHSKEFLEECKWFEQVDLEKYFAKVIFNIHHSKAITKYL